MQTPQETPPRRRSAFGAAFLSLLFPGLGHAYAGAPARALGFAAGPVLLLALAGGLALSSGLGFLAFLAANLGALLVGNLVVLGYRLAAAVDAYRVVAYLNALRASGGGRFGRPSLRLEPLSIAGLAAVCLVIAGSHAVVAKYGGQAQDLFSCVRDANCEAGAGTAASPSPGPGGSGAPTAVLPPLGTPLPTVAPATWNGKERLNILLIGADQRPNDDTFNTDTLIVVSIDPVTRQVAMFSLPRDTVDVPLPPGPAQRVFGSVYAGKINSLWTNARHRSDAFPGTDRERGYIALKQALGTLYGLDIQYYVSVNFDGFRKVVDTLGGVTVNVQTPVLDDQYPADDGSDLRVYIPAGVQHMTGAQALVYARSRHTSSDFDRAERQQRVIVSLRQQADPARILANLQGLIDDLKLAIKTDLPLEKLPQLIALSSGMDSNAIHSYVFTPPRYATEGTDARGYVVEPNVVRIRQAVADAFKVDPKAQAQQDKVATENATVWVVNGSGQEGQAGRLATYLEYLGMTATAPNQRPDASAVTSRIVVYNGREAALPATVALLEQTLGVTAVLRADPAVRVDIIVTTGRSTPDLTPPPGP